MATVVQFRAVWVEEQIDRTVRASHYAALDPVPNGDRDAPLCAGVAITRIPGVAAAREAARSILAGCIGAAVCRSSRTLVDVDTA